MMSEFFFLAPPNQAVVPGDWDLDPAEREPTKTLFDASRGEIGLIVSIFKFLGILTKETWPVRSLHFGLVRSTANVIDIQDFEKLSDANKLDFVVFPSSVLPTGDIDARQIIEKFLVYPPGARLGAGDALKEEWTAERVSAGELEAMMSGLRLPVKTV